MYSSKAIGVEKSYNWYCSFKLDNSKRCSTATTLTNLRYSYVVACIKWDTFMVLCEWTKIKQGRKIVGNINILHWNLEDEKS